MSNLKMFETKYLWILTRCSECSIHPRSAKSRRALIYTFVRMHHVFCVYITHSSVQYASRVTV